MTAEPSATGLDALRLQLSDSHRTFINTLWVFYRDHNQWVPSRIAHRHFGKASVQAHVSELGAHLVHPYREHGKDYYRLTFLGVLVTDSGAEAEDLLVRYLAYVRERYRSDPQLEWVASQEIEAALQLESDQARFLRQIVRLSHWWGGGSAFGEREWTAGLPVHVDELLAETDLRRYVREHVLRHFPVEPRVGAGVGPDGHPGGPFWFVQEGALRDQLATDWHEAQDVCHVRGWKSCVILCGGILEALLEDALRRGRAKTGTGRLGLAGLAAAAAKRRLLTKTGSQLDPALLAFRTIIRPSQAPPAVAVPGRTDAENALDAVRRCLRELAPATEPTPRPKAR